MSRFWASANAPSSRRHQKLVEEAPIHRGESRVAGARISESLRVALKKIGYSNAGTVEFLMDQSANLYFIEVNARIQVEHSGDGDW